MPGEQAGDTAIITYFPETDYVKIINELITVPTDSQKAIDFYRYPGTNKIKIFGTIPVDSDTVIDWAAVDNPTLFTLTVFKETLEKCSIAVEKVCDIDDLNFEIAPCSRLELIHTHKSVPMSEIIRVINKSSHNLYAEQVQKTIGYEIKGKGDWKSGIYSEKEWLSSIGIDPDEIFIVDGSGLSRHNMVTPFQIATVLRAMRYRSDWEAFFNSLPIGGIDGTIKDRFKGSNAVGHIFAKTGYIGYVRSLSGYLFAKDGSEYIFSIMVNHYPTPTSTVNNVQDAIITLLYNLIE
jgi:D-alanyl-D-alanine carboxypeptidase/D-alanyl-D-alanine-endopeptidase (penicillin-binding protein 4)